MKFFKHFTDSHRGRFLQDILRQRGPAGVGHYWILTELCAEKLDKEADEEYTEVHCSFNFDERYVRDSLRISSTNLREFLNLCQMKGQLSWTQNGNELNIQMPKLLECLDRDAKRARKVRGSAAPKKEEKEEEPEEDLDPEEETEGEQEEFSLTGEFLEPGFPEEFLTAKPGQLSLAQKLAARKISVDLVNTWLETYPDVNWIRTEILKALAWEASKPKNRKKHLGAFLTNWMNNGWDSRNQPKNFSNSGNQAQQKSNHNADQADRVRRGQL